MTVIIKETTNFVIVCKLQAARVPYPIKKWDKTKTKATTDTARNWASKRGHIIVEEVTCVLCGERIVGYGNNAAPLASGKCCDRCNGERVLPARLSRLLEK